MRERGGCEGKGGGREEAREKQDLGWVGGHCRLDEAGNDRRVALLSVASHPEED